MTILLLLLAALVVATVIALLRSVANVGKHGAVPAPTDAEMLLDERYARGEIDEMEYLHRRAVLRGS